MNSFAYISAVATLGVESFETSLPELTIEDVKLENLACEGPLEWFPFGEGEEAAHMTPETNRVETVQCDWISTGDKVRTIVVLEHPRL
jgi:hypothetical protein